MTTTDTTATAERLAAEREARLASPEGGWLVDLFDNVPRERPARLTAATVDAVQQQVRLAVEKHGEHTPLSLHTPDAANLATLVEEVGEVASAMSYDRGDRWQLRAELAQVAAVAAMWMQRLDAEAMVRSTEGRP